MPKDFQIKDNIISSVVIVSERLSMRLRRERDLRLEIGEEQQTCVWSSYTRCSNITKYSDSFDLVMVRSV